MNGIIRSLSRVANTIRIACSIVAEGMWVSISSWAWTGRAACTIFWSVIDAWIFCRRVAGSGSSVCSTAAIPDTWLPATLAVASVRTETGTMAISGCAGSSPRAPSHSRSMPPHSASTTSFTVHPAAFLIACASASGVEPKANRRCWLICWLKTVRGAWLRSWLSIAGTRSRMRGPPLVRRKLLTVCVSARCCTPTRRIGRCTVALSPRASISAWLGTRSGRQRLAGAGWLTGSGVVCIEASAIWVPLAPSIAQWWVLE